MNPELAAFLEGSGRRIDSVLEELLPSDQTPPQEIHRAMRYSVFAGGKRLRPALCIAGFSLFREETGPIIPIAAAIEMAHTYSLVHDDLPAMDDDDFRRGRASCHKQFDEATAILTGDALLTRSFEVISRCPGFSAERLIQVLSRFSHALGSRDGMIAGQVMDIQAERRARDDLNVESMCSWKSRSAAVPQKPIK